MKTKPLVSKLLIIATTIIAFVSIGLTHISANTNTYNPNSSSYGSDMRIPVYFAQISNADKNNARWAMNQWNATLKKKIFYEVQHGGDARVVVTAINHKYYDLAGGRHYTPSAVTFSNLVASNTNYMADWNIHNKYTKVPTKYIFEHEFGHTLGLRHASDHKDVMYRCSTTNNLSKEDIIQAKLGYAYYNSHRMGTNYYYNSPRASLGTAWAYGLNLDDNVYASKAFRNFLTISTIQNRTKAQQDMIKQIQNDASKQLSSTGNYYKGTHTKGPVSNYKCYWAPKEKQLKTISHATD